MTLVLAGNRREFLDWCRENNKNPRDRNIVYVWDSMVIRGSRGYTLVRVGTWNRRKDIAEILACLAYCKDG